MSKDGIRVVKLSLLPLATPIVGTVSVWMLAPAAVSAAALIALTLGLHRVGCEAAELRRSLRRAGAVAVAADELERLAAEVGEHGRATRRSARRAAARLRRRPSGDEDPSTRASPASDVNYSERQKPSATKTTPPVG